MLAVARRGSLDERVPHRYLESAFTAAGTSGRAAMNPANGSPTSSTRLGNVSMVKREVSSATCSSFQPIGVETVAPGSSEDEPGHGPEPDVACDLIHTPDRSACAVIPIARSSGLSGEQMATYPTSDATAICPPADCSPAARSQQSGPLHIPDICNSLKEEHMPLSHSSSAIIFGAWLAVGVPVSASANVITDWDEKAVAVLTPAGAVGGSQQVYLAQRMMGMVHAAMFDAVNSIERRYQPYLVDLTAEPATSREAAAAAYVMSG